MSFSNSAHERLSKMKFTIILLFLSTCWALIPQKDIRPDVFVLTDISNEPDDAQSLVRLLLYSNELNIHGIVATTSFWLNYTVREQDIYPILVAYEKVHPQLLKHSEHYPSVEYLRSIVSSSHPVYGLDAFKKDDISRGAKQLIDKVDKLDLDLTMFVIVWGGAAVIAEALREVRATRLKEELQLFVSKILVYSISDQDNAGNWIRINFPKLRYIASLHGFNQYFMASWIGVSGELLVPFDIGGPKSEVVTKEWLNKNIRSVGPLGAAYPEPLFIMEGDTPTLLYVLPNGLNQPLNPEYGGWGGRYVPLDLSMYLNHYCDTVDTVEGEDGNIHMSNRACIWRWRDAFQSDFKTRMLWTVSEFDESFHQPIVLVNGSVSYLPLFLDVEVSSEVTLDASGSYDLNDNKLSFKWFHYREVSVLQGNIGEVPEIIPSALNENMSSVTLDVPDFQSSCHDIFGRPLETCKEYHLILEVSNAGTRAYRRVILKTHKGERKFAEYKPHHNFDDVVHDEL